MTSFKSYYSLTKSGLVYGNLLPLIAGFALASRGNVNWGTLLAAAVGLSFIIASGCVFNNYIDRDIDAKMERTKERVLVTGRISGRNAIIFGTVLGVLGFLILILHTNPLTTAVAAVGFFVYAVVYSMKWKRTVYGPVIGSISGAVPPVVGYCAVTNQFDAAALILFLTLAIWQIPHFYAIAIYRLKDYETAGVPVLPVKKGIYATKVQMLLYIIAFAVVALMLTFFNYTGLAYFVVVLLLSIAWLALSLYGFWTKDDRRWARKMFFLSLIVLTVLCIMIAIGK